MAAVHAKIAARASWRTGSDRDGQLSRRHCSHSDSPMTTTAPSTASPSVKQNRPAQRRHRTPIDRATLRLSVLIPVYNERHTIELILDEVAATPIQKEVIVVDDC